MEGEAFYGRVAEILNNIAEATSLFSAKDENICGRLRNDLPAVLDKSCFIAIMRDFNFAFPNISLILVVTDHTIALIAEGVDCVDSIDSVVWIGIRNQIRQSIP